MKEFYKITFDGIFALCTSSKKEALDLWKVLDRSHFKELHWHYDMTSKSPSDKFYWLESTKVVLAKGRAYLYDNEDRAEKAIENQQKARKMGFMKK